jgi:CHAT domain-containing protein
MQRGPQTSQMNRPESLLDAEAAITRGLRTAPEDGSLLMARGQANLLEWSYEAAITDMQEALDTQPKSAAVLGGLAAAYFERAEAEDRFDDYGTAFELQSRALQQSPDNAIILFNRAITAARLYLYKQSIEDWHRYLTLDASGEWSDEAKQHLNEVQEIVDAHDQRTKAPLLTPAEFVRKVDPADPKTWDAVETRIEDYLSLAIKEWLPSAFPVDTKVAESVDSKRALETLAVLLTENHGDTWLENFISAKDSVAFRQGAAALAAAVLDDEGQDYTHGRIQSERALRLLTSSQNPAGRMRAEFERIYALHFADAASECLEAIGNIAPELSTVSYRWLQIQLQLERSVCLEMNGILGNSPAITSDAFRKATAAAYPSLALRAGGFWAADLGETGQKHDAWRICKKALQQYWTNSTPPIPGYNLYTFMDQLAAEAEPWFLEVAIGQQAIGLLPARQYPLWAAFEHSRLAKMATRANMPQLAENSLEASNRLFEIAPKSEFAANVRFGTEVEVAEIPRPREPAQAVLDRLQSMSPQLKRISNFYVASDYFRAIGQLEESAGHGQSAEESFESAVALTERQRSSLHSDEDRANWNQQSVESYRALVEAKINSNDIVGALAVWELYEDVASRQFEAGNVSLDPNRIDSQATEIRRVIAEETQTLSQIHAAQGDYSALVYVTLSKGIYLWSYDDRGLSGQFIQVDPAYVRMLSARLAELCAAPTSSAVGIQSVAHQLYDILFAAIEDRISPGRSIVIEADAKLSDVPFQVLVDHSGRYLADLHPIVYSQGLRYLTASDRNLPQLPAEMKALVVGVPAAAGSELPALSDAVAEAHEVASRFPQSRQLIDDEASLSNIAAELPRATMFHFVGHASTLGGKRGLLLNSLGSERKLTLLDSAALAQISLKNLRIVVLSACSTENGGDGRVLAPESLARSFLRAGVSHVVATRWNVDSAADRMFVRRFYDALVSGRTVPESVALAQARVRQIEPHPYYWAGFDAFGSP